MNYGSNVIHSVQPTGANANGAFQFQHPDHFLQKSCRRSEAGGSLNPISFTFGKKSFADFDHADLEKRIPFGHKFWT